MHLVVKKQDIKYAGLTNAICIPNLPFAYFNNNKLKKNIKYSNGKLRIGFIGKFIRTTGTIKKSCYVVTLIKILHNQFAL